jgi:hypothetical protein
MYYNMFYSLRTLVLFHAYRVIFTNSVYNNNNNTIYYSEYHGKYDGCSNVLTSSSHICLPEEGR